jgi:hypothetical protein
MRAQNVPFSSRRSVSSYFYGGGGIKQFPDVVGHQRTYLTARRIFDTPCGTPKVFAGSAGCIRA